MSSVPVNLKGLEDLLTREYSLSCVGGHLIVNDVWYLDESRNLAKGRLAAPLTLVDENTVGCFGPRFSQSKQPKRLSWMCLSMRGKRKARTAC